MGSLWTLWELQYQYQRRAALTQQLDKIETIEAELAQNQKQQEAAYQERLAQWQNVKRSVEAANRRLTDQWRRNRVVVETIRVPVEETVAAEASAEIVEDTSSSAISVDSSETAFPAAPAPAPASPPPPQYEIVQIERPVAMPALEAVPPPPEPPQPTVIEISADEGIRIELQEDTSWQTIMQLLVLILVGYGGIKLINKFVKDDEAVAN